VELVEDVIEAAADGDIGEPGAQELGEDVGLAFEDAGRSASSADDFGF